MSHGHLGARVPPWQCADMPQMPRGPAGSNSHLPCVAHLGWLAVSIFDPQPYGRGYLDLHRGNVVVMLEPPAGEAADAQWTYG